jgi:hypothetical protein
VNKQLFLNVETPSNKEERPVILQLQFSFLELLKDFLALKSYFSFRSTVPVSSSSSSSLSSSSTTIQQTEQTILRKEQIDKIVNQHFNENGNENDDVSRLSKFFD